MHKKLIEKKKLKPRTKWQRKQQQKTLFYIRTKFFVCFKLKLVMINRILISNDEKRKSNYKLTIKNSCFIDVFGSICQNVHLMYIYVDFMSLVSVNFLYLFLFAV